MTELLILALMLLGFLCVFAFTFYAEIKRTPWDLFEAIVLFAIAGHAIALPVAWAVQDSNKNWGGDWLVVLTGTLATIVALFMVGGAVWVFRRLNRINETRRKVRLAYLVLGTLMFPAMLALIVGVVALKEREWLAGLPLLMLSSAVLFMLVKLHAQTATLPDPGNPAKPRTTGN